jgi:hypothetical protein
MKSNVGTIDRTLRIIVGLGLIGYGVATHSWIGALGVIPLLTGFLRFCPVYCPLGLNTTGKNDKGGGCCGGGQCG